MSEYQVGEQAACQHCGQRITLVDVDALGYQMKPYWVDRSGLWHCTPQERYRSAHQPEARNA